MQGCIVRQITEELLKSLPPNPVKALFGPRQCGKSTLARHALGNRRDASFLDLELPSDLQKLSDPELFLCEHADKLVSISGRQWDGSGK